MPSLPARINWVPWLFSAPALAVFVSMLLTPLVLTGLLSLYVFDGMRGIQDTLTLHNFVEIFTDSYYLEIFTRTAAMSAGVTFICIAIGVPETLILSRMQGRWKSIFLLIVLAPLLISVIVRTLGWSILLGANGLINQTLLELGIVDKPIRMVFTMTGVTIAMVHVMVPFMIMSVWATIQKLDPQIEQASLSLGASRLKTFFQVILPQLLPGILSGSIIVFALSASAFATPALLGGRKLKVVATAAYDEFLSTLNWPLGAAIVIVLLVANIIVIIGCNRWVENRFRAVFEG